MGYLFPLFYLYLFLLFFQSGRAYRFADIGAIHSCVPVDVAVVLVLLGDSGSAEFNGL